ncbi:MAG: hypothetical protein ACYC5O_06255 [Anaerolineae bacterium]
MDCDERERPLSTDALLLIVLVVARLRIDTLANLVAPRPEETVRTLPLLGGLLSSQAWDLMRNWLTDPVSLLLVTLALALLGLYLLVDALRHRLSPPATFRLKLALVLAIVLVTVVAQSLFLVLLRHATGPASFTHDGGVIQTEAAVDMLLRGENPYTHDYLDTPLAEWGLEKRTALYHYPYLPWTLIASVPARALSYAGLGWYDQRFVYLALFVLTLLLLPGLARRPGDRLALVMIVGLNPIMANDVIFGMNDSFVLAWIVLGLWLLARDRFGWAAVAIGLAWASKPTAWFLAPFYLLYLARGAATLRAAAAQVWRRAWPAFAVATVLVVPFFLWEPFSFYDDVWAWAAGTSVTPYQIRGWGFSNLVLALGLVPSDQSYFPFWIAQAAICLPLLLATLRWQARAGTAGATVGLRRLLYGFAALFAAYSFFSRFFNENYAGFAISLFALAALVETARNE